MGLSASASKIPGWHTHRLRYDGIATGALQGLAPGHVVYIGSASKRLIPALRLGWMLLPSG